MPLDKKELCTYVRADVYTNVYTKTYINVQIDVHIEVYIEVYIVEYMYCKHCLTQIVSHQSFVFMSLFVIMNLLVYVRASVLKWLWAAGGENTD